MDALAQYDYHQSSFSGPEGYHDFPQPHFTFSVEGTQYRQSAGDGGGRVGAPIAGNNCNNKNNNTKSRPCDACRRRKSRCVSKDGAAKCVLCEFHNQSCTYVQTPQARKRKSVSISQDEEVIVSSIRSPVRDIDRQRSLSQQTSIITSPKADQIVDDYANLKGPSLLKRTLGLQRRRHGLYQGSSSYFESALIREDGASRPWSAQGDAQFLRANAHDRFLLLSDEATEHYDGEVADIDSIEAIVAPHGQTMINLYFRIVHPSFPILHKKVFLEKYNRTHQEFSPPLLAAVYVLALQYWSYEDELSRCKKPAVEDLVELAMRSLAYVVHRPKLSTVEAGLLLLQWRTGSSSWALTAQMVAVGQELGLHRDCSSWNIPSWERGLRKRLAWALFMQDKWSCLIHGRPSHIFKDDWVVQPLTEKDFPENATDDDEREGSTDVEKGRNIFCNMVSLTQILADVLQTFYSGTAEAEIREVGGTNATKVVLSRVKPLQMRLKAWHSSLPESLSMDNVTVRKLSSAGYMHLAFWATEISLHRCIFRTLQECSENELVGICRAAAKVRLAHAMAFVKALKAEHLQSFWYFASAFNLALVGIFQAMVCVSAEMKEERNIEIAKLDEYRWLLRISSKSAGFLEQSMVMLNVYVGDLKALIPSGEHDGGLISWSGGNSPQKSFPIADRSKELQSAEGESGFPAGETPHFEDEASRSLRTDDNLLAWYAHTPSTEQTDHSLRA